MDDFNEMMRKAMAEEMQDGSDDDGDEDLSMMFEKISAHGLVKMASECKEKIENEVLELRENIKDLDVKNKAMDLAKAVTEIKIHANKIASLHTIMQTCSLGAMALHTGKDLGTSVDVGVRMSIL